MAKTLPPDPKRDMFAKIVALLRPRKAMKRKDAHHDTTRPKLSVDITSSGTNNYPGSTPITQPPPSTSKKSLERERLQLQGN